MKNHEDEMKAVEQGSSQSENAVHSQAQEQVNETETETENERYTSGGKSLEDLTHQELVKTQLKVLLLHLAARSKHPSAELEGLLHEVIDELHAEVKAALDQRAQFRLVMGGGE
jgi:hypothetical protein